MKSKIALALTIAVVAAAFIWQHLAVRQFQEETTALQAQLAELKAAPAPSSADSIAPEEAKRLREEHGELMQLRGEYSQWKQKAAASSVEIQNLQKQLDTARRDLQQQVSAVAPEGTRRTPEALAADASRRLAVYDAIWPPPDVTDAHFLLGRAKKGILFVHDPGGHRGAGTLKTASVAFGTLIR